jgi:hypothetical protein
MLAFWEGLDVADDVDRSSWMQRKDVPQKVSSDDWRELA